MTKFKQTIFAVMILGLGIVLLNSSLFSSGSNPCNCYSYDPVETACDNYCASIGSSCMVGTRLYSVCSQDYYCVSTFRLVCNDGTYTDYRTSQECITCYNW